MKGVLDSQQNAGVAEVFAGWKEGHLSHEAICTALFDSGEMDRWNTVSVEIYEYQPTMYHFKVFMESCSMKLRAHCADNFETHDKPSTSPDHCTALTVQRAVLTSLVLGRMEMKARLSSETARMGLRWLAVLFFVCAGANHFLHSHFYAQLVPPGFPVSKFLVIVSGLAEVAGGLGLLIPRLRRAAGWGLIGLLVAVFPANIYMALDPGRFGMPPWILWARLPLQVVFITWVWWVALYRAQRIRTPPS